MEKNLENIVSGKLTSDAWQLNSLTMRYTPTNGGFVMRGYVKSLDQIGEIRVSEVDLLRIIAGQSWNALDDLDNDSYEDIVFLRKFFNLSPSVLSRVKRQWHRKRLGRCLTAVYALSRKQYHTKEPEWDENLERYDEIYRNAVIKDNFIVFEMLVKALCKYKKVPYKKTEWVEKYRKSRESIIWDYDKVVAGPEVFKI